jgi:DNA-binding transcriptional LysR family regulator
MKTYNTLPSPTELKYFLEVANSLKLSRASERLGISQPSLSVAIKRLEELIGTPLFSRHQHGVVLTQAGKQLQAHAKQLLQNWECVKSKALASQHEAEGSFSLGCHSTMVNHIVSKFLPDLLEKNSKLELQLKYDIPRNITEKVINFSLDIGIAANPLRHSDLIIQKLCDDVVTFWKGDGKRKIQDITSGKAIILCDLDLTQTQFLLKSTKKNGIMYERMITMNSLEALADLTAKGCGIGILPERVANALYPNKLVKIPKMPKYQDELCLIYRNENRNNYGIQAIIKAIKDSFKSNKH